jgi:hypothetical protein
LIDIRCIIVDETGTIVYGDSVRSFSNHLQDLRVLAFILSEDAKDPLHVVLVNTRHLSSPTKAQYDIKDLIKVNRAFNDAQNVLQICTFQSVYSYSKCPDAKNASSSTRGVGFDISKFDKISNFKFDFYSVCHYALIDKTKKLLALFEKVITTTMTFKNTGRGISKVTKCSFAPKANKCFSGKQM